ncbi:MAG TPA: HEAT repeat domain-containing protein, partial [Gemmataceae bacterium]|nr:HEAT repeat domain-containing protein [Gemmataceae bacterium]
MRLRPIFLLAAAVFLATGRAGIARDKDDVGDEVKLQATGLGTDGAALVEFFKNRTLSSVSAEKLNGLIEKLGDKETAERAKAFRELLGLGPLAVPALRQAISDPDSTTSSEQARRCLKLLIGEDAAELPILAARVLAKQRTKGATTALLTYLPFADSEQVIEEVKQAIAEVGHDEDNKPDDALVKAVEDKAPVRRAVAAEVLANRGTAPREVLRKLLADAKPSVRLRAALALAQAKEPKAVSTLIVLLAELPFNQAREAEDYLMNLASEKAPKQALGTDDASRQKARDAWAEWWLKSEGPNLLDEFKKRTMDEEAREKTLKLISTLGSDNFKQREAAADELKKMGVLVLPLLRKASTDDKDPEVRDRSKKCLVEIEKTETGPLSPVTARLVAYRKPEGAAEVLLKFLPFADDEAVLTEVQLALNAVAYEDGKPVPAVVAALGDKLPLRRAAAAEALAQAAASKKEIAEVRKLLKDTEALVRMRASLGLAGIRDRDAVPVLIETIADLPSEQSGPAEEYLSRLAGDAAPQGNSGGDADARKKRSEAWAKWWKDNGEKVRLVSLTETPQVERHLGYTLLVSPNQSRIAEVDKSGKTRWEMTNLSNPWDAQILANNRVLVLEQGTRRITERTLRG